MIFSSFYGLKNIKKMLIKFHVTRVTLIKMHIKVKNPIKLLNTQEEHKINVYFKQWMSFLVKDNLLYALIINDDWMISWSYWE